MCECPPSAERERAIEQRLTGLTPGGVSTTVHCTACGGEVQVGADIVVYAQRRSEDAVWRVPRVYCRSCFDEVESTLGVEEVTVRARLGSVLIPTGRAHRPCLTEVSLLAWWGPAK